MADAPTCKDCKAPDAWWDGLCMACNQLLDDRRHARGWRCYQTPCKGRWLSAPEDMTPKQAWEQHCLKVHDRKWYGP